IRRVENAQDLKCLIKDQGVTLTRRGRSRNWTIELNTEQSINLQKSIESAKQESWLWVANLLKKQRPELNLKDLKTLAKEHWPISVNQLMRLTDCTSAQARLVIDEIEWSE
ncbi:hypothetical protein, partial [Oleiphilus sp. HI0067]